MSDGYSSPRSLPINQITALRSWLKGRGMRGGVGYQSLISGINIWCIKQDMVDLKDIFGFSLQNKVYF